MRTAEPAINIPPPPEEQPRHSGHSRLQTVASSSRHSASCSHIRQHWSSKWKEVFVQLELWTAVVISVLPGTHSDTLLILRCWFFHWKPQPCCLTALLSGKKKNLQIFSVQHIRTILYCTIYTIYHI